MQISLSVLEHGSVPIELREILSFTRAVSRSLTKKIINMQDVTGCVLLSTCNRTELYVTSSFPTDPGRLLCAAAEVPHGPFEAAFTHYTGEDAVWHLLEVSAGLRSRVFGEDQIIAQVKDAIEIARSVKAADPVLETLFRTAISGGKEVRSSARLTALPTSAAGRAVDILDERLGGLKGKRAMVIGNGEMGRLSASLLSNKGCEVTVTLRTYRHGETVIPPGCAVVPYEERFTHMDGMDCLISATASPHFTIKAEDIGAIPRPPRLMIDLAIPRDIQPEVGNFPGVTALDVDDLGDSVADYEVPPLVREILQKHRDNFYRWQGYKDCMPVIEELKKTVLARLVTCRELEYGLDSAELLEFSVDRAVELLVAGLSKDLSGEALSQCSEKIRNHTTAKPVLDGVSI